MHRIPCEVEMTVPRSTVLVEQLPEIQNKRQGRLFLES